MPLHSETHPLGLPFIELQSVDSTNKYAMHLAHERMARHGMALFAHEQTSGKGQRGKAWQTEKGKNIILSVLVNGDHHPVDNMFRLSACTAVAAIDFFSHYAGNETTVKWPNDIYWRDRKAGGILIENIVAANMGEPGKWKWSVIGIGININQTSFAPDIPNPVSLKQITGKNYDPIELAKALCAILDKWYINLSDDRFGNILDRYNEHLYCKNKKVKLKTGSRVFEALIKGVNHFGQLMIQHRFEENIDYGKVEWVR